MELKLFGKEIFNFKTSKSDRLLESAFASNRESKFMPDFYTMRDHQNNSDFEWVAVPSLSDSTSASITGNIQVQVKKKEAELKKSFSKTPKRVFELKYLNKSGFKINTDPKYVDEQLKLFKDKLDLIKTAEYDMSRGVNDIASLVLRLENRKKYPEHKDFFEQFAYTTTDRINSVLKNHSNLKLGLVEQFIADMPKEAIEVMKQYNKECKDLCGKQTVFYIIADKKDFKKSEQRRDPILLAQSPYSHVWQILGAWDEEMMFLEEL